MDVFCWMALSPFGVNCNHGIFAADDLEITERRSVARIMSSISLLLERGQFGVVGVFVVVEFQDILCF